MPSRKRHFRNKQTSNKTDYALLEQRKVLTANVAAGLQVSVDLPPAMNLVVNGEFEEFDQGTAFSTTNAFATARFLPGDQVAGFGVIDGDGDGTTNINLLSFDNDFGTILDLDSSPGQDDRIFQDIVTEQDQLYVLSFDFFGSPALAGGEATNDFEVFWNDTLVASITGSQVTQTASFTVLGESSTPISAEPGESVISRLEFRDASGGGDGRGALINNVRLVAATEIDVVNGGFEDTGSAAGPGFAAEDVPGFSVFDFPDDTEPRVIQIDQFSDTDPSIGGDNFLTLNSDPTRIDQVFQDLATEAGRSYYVTFDYRVDPTSDAAADQLRVRWNGEFAATFFGTTDWQAGGILLDADSDITRLNFREAGEDTGDGASPQIDNVRVFVIDQIVNDLVVDLNGAADGLATTAEFTGEGPVAVAPELTLDHESGTQLSAASVALVGDPPASTETLNFDSSLATAAGLTGFFDPTTGVLSFTGSATVDQYQELLQSVTYENAIDPLVAGARDISFSIADEAIVLGGTTSSPVLATVSVTPNNTPPALATIADVETAFAEQVAFDVIGSDLDGDALSFSVAVADLNVGEAQPTISDTGSFSWTPTEAGEFEVTVTATDALGASTEQTFAVTVGSLGDIPVTERNGIFDQASGFNIDTDNTFDAVISTTVGDITIRLLDDESPTFVNNFVNLARDGFYDGTVFHRVVSAGGDGLDDDFVAQGGDPLGLGTGGPGFQIPDEVGNTIPFDSRGQLSFANAGNNTTGSQFFITLSPTNLNTGQFSVFGNVTEGDAVLDLLTRTSQIIPFAGETPIAGSVPTVVNSITIIETPSEDA